MAKKGSKNGHQKTVLASKNSEKLDNSEDEKHSKKEVLDVSIGSKTCQTMEVALWIKKMSKDKIDEFIDFMESLGFKYIEYREPNKKELKGKIYIIFFSYNSCAVCRIAGVERPLSMDLSMLDLINTVFDNCIVDFHNINPRCDYLKSKEEKGVKDLDGSGDYE